MNEGFVDAGEKLLQGLAAGLYQAAVDIMFVSQHECPIDTGTLRASGRVNEPVRTLTGIEVTLGYGYGEQVNPETGELALQYAIPVHERTNVRHEPPTKAKFLEDPALAYTVLFERTLAVWMQRARVDVTGGLSFQQEQIVPSLDAEAMAPVVAGSTRRGAIMEFSQWLGAARAVGEFLRATR